MMPTKPTNTRLLIAGAILGLSADDLLRLMLCELCRLGLQPKNGVHTILGIDIPCGASPPEEEEE